jgi:hypothetical protein
MGGQNSRVLVRRTLPLSRTPPLSPAPGTRHPHVPPLHPSSIHPLHARHSSSRALPAKGESHSSPKALQTPTPNPARTAGGARTEPSPGSVSGAYLPAVAAAKHFTGGVYLSGPVQIMNRCAAGARREGPGARAVGAAGPCMRRRARRGGRAWDLRACGSGASRRAIRREGSSDFTGRLRTAHFLNRRRAHALSQLSAAQSPHRASAPVHKQPFSANPSPRQPPLHSCSDCAFAVVPTRAVVSYQPAAYPNSKPLSAPVGCAPGAWGAKLAGPPLNCSFALELPPPPGAGKAAYAPGTLTVKVWLANGESFGGAPVSVAAPKC